MLILTLLRTCRVYIFIVQLRFECGPISMYVRLVTERLALLVSSPMEVPLHVPPAPKGPIARVPLKAQPSVRWANTVKLGQQTVPLVRRGYDARRHQVL